MSKIEVDHMTPSGTVAYVAYLYFDDGDNPNAEVEDAGYWTTEKEAWAAIRTAMEAKPRRQPSKIIEGNTAVWCGMPEKGTLVKDEDDEWFMEPSFERDENYDAEPVYRD